MALFVRKGGSRHAGQAALPQRNIHRAVRNFYDTYGYPVSKHIKSAWSADITYLIMKPLEWIFLVVLYLFDEKPEDRICRQYLPEGTCGMK